MDRKILIAPSLLAADFTRLAGEIREAELAGADILHVDIMDGRFVPNISVGPLVIRAVRRVTKLPLCAHLMIEAPWKYTQAFAEAGADEIIVHAEACGTRLAESLALIRRLDKNAGISLKPETPASAALSASKDVDTVLVMTVNPGFGGQPFLREMLPKIREIRAGFTGNIAVDGGVNAETAPVAVQAGANVLVAGTAVFGNGDIRGSIEKIRCRLP